MRWGRRVVRTDPTYTDGCSGCHGTGLHEPGAYRWSGLPDKVLRVERHDACLTFASDAAAAQFYVWAHPEYRWLVYISEEGGVEKLSLHRPLPINMPAVQEGSPVFIVGREGLRDFLSAIHDGVIDHGRRTQ